MNSRLDGKTALVTGATAGIGRVAAEALARMGARVVLVSRNEEKCVAVADQMRKATGNSGVIPMHADLSRREEIKELAERFLSRFDALHILVNNAGAFFRRYRENAEGMEMTFALNHLGYFRMTRLLLDRLKESSPSRIVNVASNAHRGMMLDFDDLQCRKKYNGWLAYGRSKLANVLFTCELARRLEGTQVTANALHPGVVVSDFFSSGGFSFPLRMMVRFIGISEEKGARTIIHLASSEDVEGVTGRYFVKNKAVPSSEASLDQASARRLWEVSEELTGPR